MDIKQIKIDDLNAANKTVETNLREKENKYDLLAEEFNSVQKNFSAYKASREEVKAMHISRIIRYCRFSFQMEDPFVLRLALNVSRRQLWDLQNKMNDIDHDGSSIIATQLHQQVK